MKCFGALFATAWLLFLHPQRCASQILFESTGNEFVVGFTRNSVPPVQLSLFVTTPDPAPVGFTVETLTGFRFSGRVATGTSVTRVDLPTNLQVRSAKQRNKGVRIMAEEGKRIAVYGTSMRSVSSESFLALPCTQLPAIEEYEYYAVMYHDEDFQTGLNSGWGSRILLVGCADDTTITVSGSVLSTSVVTTINKLETYLIERLGDLTGTRIVSNKPISVVTSHECTRVPTGVEGCDYLIEQVPPTVTWGKFFLAASFGERVSGELYRVLAAQDSTTVAVNCNTLSESLIITLTNAGDWQEFNTSDGSFCSIESNHPVLVMEFTLGDDNSNLDVHVGDPSMVMLQPANQYANRYTVASLANFTNYLTIFVVPEYFKPTKIFLDDISLRGTSWTPVRCSDNTVCGYIHVTRLDVTQQLQHSNHHLYHEDVDATIGMLVYGFRFGESYSHPGGIQLVPTGPPLNFEIISEGQRILTFTWDPPAVNQRKGDITGYLLSCDPQPIGFPRMFEDSDFNEMGGVDPVTLSGFTPPTTYRCSVKSSTSVGDGLAARATAKTKEDSRLFQLSLSGAFTCDEWTMADTSSKLQFITDAVHQKIEELCQCGFTGHLITDARFECFNNSGQVTYRARLNGTAQATSLQLIRHIERWIAEDVTIPVRNLRLSVNSTCPVPISSFDDPECQRLETDNSGGHKGVLSSYMFEIIGVSAAVLLVFAVITITAVSCGIVKWYHTKSSQEPHLTQKPVRWSGMTKSETLQKEREMSRSQQSHEYEIPFTLCVAYAPGLDETDCHSYETIPE